MCQNDGRLIDIFASVLLRGLPVLQLLSPVTHPWVNTYLQVVGHPDLHGWDGTNPPLIGDIVAAVIQEFSRDDGNVSTGGRDQSPWETRRQQSGFPAAQPAHGTQNSMAGNPPTSMPTGGGSGIATVDPVRTDGTGSTQSRGIEGHPKKPQHHTPIPAIPVTFSELQDLSTEQLSRLLDDESARQALLLGMASVVQMKDLRTDVRKGNVETARLTIEKQDDASVLRNEGEKMKTELKALQTSYEGTKALSGTPFNDAAVQSWTFVLP